MTQYKNRCIFHSPINTSFVSKSYCAFFIPGGLSLPEFSCALFKDKKVPPWNRKSAPRTEKKRPPEKSNPPINFPLLTKSVTWDTVCGVHLLWRRPALLGQWLLERGTLPVFEHRPKGVLQQPLWTNSIPGTNYAGQWDWMLVRPCYPQGLISSIQNLSSSHQRGISKLSIEKTGEETIMVNPYWWYH